MVPSNANTGIQKMANSIQQLFAKPSFQLTVAKLSRIFLPRLKFGNTLVLSNWRDINEVLDRDIDFVIEPINKEKIERVNGPFILGMDRSANHIAERELLYQTLNQGDIPRIQNLALCHAQSLLNKIKPDAAVDVVNGYARRVASRSASALMGVEGPSEEDQMRVARAMFHELFLNIENDSGVRTKAIKVSAELNQWVIKNIADTRSHGASGENMIVRMIKMGIKDNDLIRRTVSGLFVGAIDTTATCVAQIIHVILKRPKLKLQVMADLDDSNKMRGWCYEALRFWPHNPIVLRQAAHDCALGKLTVKAGTNVACFTLAAMHDPAAFPHPSVLLPNRPLANYLHFGGGLHPCAGRAINGVQIPVLVGELLRREPEIQAPVKHDGPFPNELLVKLHI